MMNTLLLYGKVFLVGGALCAVAEILMLRTRLTPARILVGYVTAGVILGALGLYEPLVEWAGAGATVPLTGFGNALAKGALQGAAEQGILGAFTGGITATAGGIAAAIFFGYLASIIFAPKSKG
jgi:stage V sporulation protein AE